MIFKSTFFIQKEMTFRGVPFAFSFIVLMGYVISIYIAQASLRAFFFFLFTHDQLDESLN